jgi:hypothetical protein
MWDDSQRRRFELPVRSAELPARAVGRATLVCAREIYGPLFNPQLTLKALSFFGDGNLHRLPRDLQDRLARAAREVDLDRLPEIADLVRSFGQDLGTKP